MVERCRAEQRVPPVDVVRREVLGIVDDRDVTQRGQLAAHLEEALEEPDVLDDRDRRLAVPDEVLHLLRRRGVVDRDRCRAEQQHRGVGDVELRPVPHHEHDPVAVADTELAQRGRDPGDAFGVVAPGPLAEPVGTREPRPMSANAVRPGRRGRRRSGRTAPAASASACSSRGPRGFPQDAVENLGRTVGYWRAARPEEFVGARLTGRFSTSSPRDVCVPRLRRAVRCSGFPTDRVVAVGQRPTRVADVRGRARQARGRAGHRDAVDFDEHVARLRVRVGEQFAHRVDGRDRGLGRLERGEHLGSRTRTDPRGDDAVELLAVLGARREASRSVSSPSTPSSASTRVRDRLGRRRDRDPLAVGALVRAARHGVRDAGTEPRLVVVEVRGRRRQRRHHLQHRLEQVHVDDLTLARAVAMRAARPSPRTRPRARRPRR